jgi:hypothetical protein
VRMQHVLRGDPVAAEPARIKILAHLQDMSANVESVSGQELLDIQSIDRCAADSTIVVV